MDVERVLDFYSPAKSWISEQLQIKREKIPLLGISAPQGTGKSTFANYLVKNLKEEKNINALEISIDDFYLTRDDQLKLAQSSAHPYLQERGYPGTHDMNLMYETLDSLQAGKLVDIPRYNKSAFDGKGDRFPLEKWTRLEHKPDLIILEGWMLGYAPLETVSDDMKKINEVLEGYHRLNRSFDFFIHLHALESHYVLDWRAQAEKERREMGKGAMGQEEIIEYLKLFIPCYETYNPVLLEKKSLECPVIRFELDKKRALAQTLMI
jgi:D-glycerate 3-kinase